ncbi:MAG: DUF4097 family beta strand repeat-containing protein [Solirubrobacteraceae bacterium]
MPPVLRRLGALRGWPAAVAVSSLLLAAAGIALALDWVLTSSRRGVAYAVGGHVRSVELRIASGSVAIRGGRPGDTRVRVGRLERYAFGRRPRERRSLAAGVLRVAERCPPVVVGHCSAAYAVTVPENVAVSVRTGEADVRLLGFHGSARIATGAGDVTVDAFCGFHLAAATASGRIRAIAACAPKSLALRTVSGDATAVVPPGRYRVRAQSATGGRRVSGVLASAAAPFRIDVRSRRGTVTVRGGL